jgi:hypothetical protein
MKPVTTQTFCSGSGEPWFLGFADMYCCPPWAKDLQRADRAEPGRDGNQLQGWVMSKSPEITPTIPDLPYISISTYVLMHKATPSSHNYHLVHYLVGVKIETGYFSSTAHVCSGANPSRLSIQAEIENIGNCGATVSFECHVKLLKYFQEQNILSTPEYYVTLQGCFIQIRCIRRSPLCF